MRAAFLASGSAGNATLVSHAGTSVLIDCGLSAREIVARLARVGVAPSEIDAILVTHEHVDHVRGIEVFVRRHHAAPVLMTEGTARACRALGAGADTVELLRTGSETAIGRLTVHAFRTSHDAADPVGYVVTADDGTRIGLATDTGTLTAEAVEALVDCTILGIETNHDPGMLRGGPYPPHLKRRIASDRGHLANLDAALALRSLASDRLRHVVGLHVSRTNNTQQLAHAVLADEVRSLGLDASSLAATQHTPACVES